MKEWIERSLELNKFHWKGGTFQWIFYTSIIIILILEKRRSRRIVFALLPICYLLALFNPLFALIQSWTDIADIQYFARMYSFMPMMTTIAFAATVLLKRVKQSAKPVLLIIIGLMIVMTGNNIYEQSWFITAKNHAKVDPDVYDILAALEGAEEPVKIATINPIANYLRQVSDVITPYGREVGELGIMLSSDNPDVAAILSMAGELDMDYLAPPKTDGVLSAFNQWGYEPYAETEKYVIYKVKGVPRWKRTFDEHRQVILKTNYGTEDKPEKTIWGYTSIAYEFDRYGNPIRLSYLDEDGKLFLLDGIYATMVREFSNRGRELSISFLGLKDELVFVSGRYLTRYWYDIEGRCIKETYHDIDGRMMNRTDTGSAYKTFDYDKEGHRISVRYYNKDNILTLDPDGYAGYNNEYVDSEGVKIKRVYVGLKGEELFCEYLDVP